jgi:hypothetical protein
MRRFTTWITNNLDDMRNRISEWNERAAVFGVLVFGSMICFWAFVIFCLLPLIPALAPHLPVLLFISNSFQLALLPLLMVGQRIVSDKQQREAQKRMDIQEERATEDHTHLIDIHEAVFKHLTAQDELIRRLYDQVTGEEPPEIRASSMTDLRSMHAKGSDRFTK